MIKFPTCLPVPLKFQGNPQIFTVWAAKMANCKVMLDLIGEKKNKKEDTKRPAKVTVLCSKKLQIFGERHVRELTQQSFRRPMLNTHVTLLEENQKCSGSTKVPVLLQPFRIQKIHSIVCEDY